MARPDAVRACIAAKYFTAVTAVATLKASHLRHLAGGRIPPSLSRASWDVVPVLLLLRKGYLVHLYRWSGQWSEVEGLFRPSFIGVCERERIGASAGRPRCRLSTYVDRIKSLFVPSCRPPLKPCLEQSPLSSHLVPPGVEDARHRRRGCCACCRNPRLSLVAEKKFPSGLRWHG